MFAECDTHTYWCVCVYRVPLLYALLQRKWNANADVRAILYSRVLNPHWHAQDLYNCAVQICICVFICLCAASIICPWICVGVCVGVCVCVCVCVCTGYSIRKYVRFMCCVCSVIRHAAWQHCSPFLILFLKAGLWYAFLSALFSDTLIKRAQ